jgi:hypothetical protein
MGIDSTLTEVASLASLKEEIAESAVIPCSVGDNDEILGQ